MATVLVSGVDKPVQLVSVIGQTGAADTSGIPSTGATLTNVASSASSVTLIAANAARKTLIIANDSTAILYINLAGATASTSAYSVNLGPTATSIASTVTINNFTGAVTGIWASANGSARISELT